MGLEGWSSTVVHTRDSVCMGSTSQNSTGGAHVTKKSFLRSPCKRVGVGTSRKRSLRAAPSGSSSRARAIMSDDEGLGWQASASPISALMAERDATPASSRRTAARRTLSPATGARSTPKRDPGDTSPKKKKGGFQDAGKGNKIGATLMLLVQENLAPMNKKLATQHSRLEGQAKLIEQLTKRLEELAARSSAEGGGEKGGSVLDIESTLPTRLEALERMADERTKSEAAGQRKVSRLEEQASAMQESLVPRVEALERAAMRWKESESSRGGDLAKQVQAMQSRLQSALSNTVTPAELDEQNQHFEQELERREARLEELSRGAEKRLANRINEAEEAIAGHSVSEIEQRLAEAEAAVKRAETPHGGTQVTPAALEAVETRLAQAQVELEATSKQGRATAVKLAGCEKVAKAAQHSADLQQEALDNFYDQHEGEMASLKKAINDAAEKENARAAAEAAQAKADSKKQMGQLREAVDEVASVLISGQKEALQTAKLAERGVKQLATAQKANAAAQEAVKTSLENQAAEDRHNAQTEAAAALAAAQTAQAATDRFHEYQASISSSSFSSSSSSASSSSFFTSIAIVSG